MSSSALPTYVEQLRSFDIPEQSLNGALLRLARQAGAQVLYDSAMVQEAAAPGSAAR